MSVQGVSRAEGLAKHRRRLGFRFGFGLEECAYHSLDQRRHSVYALSLCVCVCGRDLTADLVPLIVEP